MRKTNLLVSVFLVLLSQAFSYARAEAPASPAAVGSITFLEGVSDIERNGRTPEFIKEKEPVYINDIVRTKNYSKAEITFLDKSVLKLAPDSSVSIAEYKLDGKNKREHSSIKLTRGRIEAIVSKTGAPDTFLVETPNAQGAVKGSDIFFSYLGGKTGVFVLDGAISVFNPALPGTKVNVTKDNCVVVPFNNAPGEIRTTRDAEIDYFKSSVRPAFIKKWIPSQGATQMNGVIVALTGSVRIYKKGADNWRALKINDIVSEGDNIQTEENSTIEIRMSNGNTVVLQPYTELSFTTLRQDPATGSYENTLKITAGRLSAVVTRTKDQLAFQVQTPSAICGVRGTFMEVVVTPPAAVSQGAPASEPAQPVTQVFFEGGNGYITSNLTSQTQEIGSGQNAIVDAMGTVSAPIDTAPEQRSAMFQTWTSAHTMNNYSSAEGATGVGSNTQQQDLPQAPVGLMQAADTVVNEDIQSVIDETSVLDLNDLTIEPVIQEIYKNTFDFSPSAVIFGETISSSVINGGSVSVTAFDNYTLNLITSGTFENTIDGPEEVIGTFVGSGSDVLCFFGTGAKDSGGVEVNEWTGTVTGIIGSLTPSAVVIGNMSGTYTYTGEGELGFGVGTFEGRGSGSWVPYVE